MKTRNFKLKAFLLTAVVLLIVCGLALAETLNVARTEAKYGFEFSTDGDEITFEKGDTLKAVATDPIKLQTWLKPTVPVKGDKLTMIYLGKGKFTVMWMPAGKFARMHVAVGLVDLN